MAPVAFAHHITSPALLAMASLPSDQLFQLLGLHEFLPSIEVGGRQRGLASWRTAVTICVRPVYMDTGTAVLTWQQACLICRWLCYAPSAARCGSAGPAPGPCLTPVPCLLQVVARLEGQLCSVDPDMCDNFLTAIAGFNASNVDPQLLPLFLSYTPAGEPAGAAGRCEPSFWWHAAPCCPAFDCACPRAPLAGAAALLLQTSTPYTSLRS